jgi:hypothetical protein
MLREVVQAHTLMWGCPHGVTKQAFGEHGVSMPLLLWWDAG